MVKYDVFAQEFKGRKIVEMTPSQITLSFLGKSESIVSLKRGDIFMCSYMDERSTVQRKGLTLIDYKHQLDELSLQNVHILILLVKDVKTEKEFELRFDRMYHAIVKVPIEEATAPTVWSQSKDLFSSSCQEVDEANIQELISKVQELTQTVNSQADTIRLLEGRIDDLESGDTAALGDTIETLEERVSTLETSVGQLTTESVTTLWEENDK